MNIRATLTVVLCLPLLLLRTGPSQAQPGNPAVQQPAGADRALVFRTTGHLAAFLPGRTCLVTLDHALCVEFVDGAHTAPQSATSSTPAAAASLGERPLPLGEVRYEALWPGIDLVYSGVGGNAKATYLVAPGADPNSIRLRYNVAATLQTDGSLRFEPTSGRGVLTESAPVAWQEIGGRRVPVDVTFVVSGDSAVRFRLGTYDHRYPLTIDPTYEWHTFYGSGGADWCQDIVVDGAGNVYVVGGTYETWLGDGGTEPLHAHSPGSNLDFAVLKLGPDGGYLWHTFYGSSAMMDGIDGVAVDAAGNVYVTGHSYATWTGSDGELPLHAYTGSADMVVLKLDSNGTYQWHTFYGSGSNEDIGTALALDGMGGLYVTGYSLGTWQGDGDAAPLHPYAGDNEAVVLKLNTDGAYQWHTFYGSGGWERGRDMAIDGSGNVYVAGSSSDTWQGDDSREPLHPYTAGGNYDMFVLKLSSNGAHQWHTFYGASDSDMLETAMELTVDEAGSVFAVGAFIGTWQGDGGVEPLHPHSSGGFYDIVVLKLDSNGAYQWHTFYGSGTGDDIGPGVAVDGASNVYVVGNSAATWLGNGGEPPLHAHSGGGDVLVFKLTPSGTYQWHTFYGPYGNGDDALDIALDGIGNLHVAGDSIYTWQGDGDADPLHLYSGDADLMVLKLAGDTETSVNPIAGGTLVFTNTRGLTTTLQVPPGAVSQCTDLAYTPLFSPTETIDPGDVYAHHAFLLHAYPCDIRWHVYLPIIRWNLYLPLVMRDVTSGPLPAGPTTAPFLAPGDPVFQEPVTMTLQYSDTDVTGIDENTLHVVYWTGSGWEDMAGTCGPPPAYDRDLDNNRLSFTFCHMSQGALVGN